MRVLNNKEYNSVAGGVILKMIDGVGAVDNVIIAPTFPSFSDEVFKKNTNAGYIILGAAKAQ